MLGNNEIFIGLGALLIAAGAVIGVRTKMASKKPMISLVAAGLAVILIGNSFAVIPTGYSGVRTTFGQISKASMANGINFKIPFIQSVQLVNNKQQDMDFPTKIWSETKDRTAIYYADVTVTYQINPEKSAWIYSNVADYEYHLVSESLVASAIKSSSKELSDTDATNRSIIEPLAMKRVQESLDEKYGESVVYINKVVIGNADFDESYNEAVAAKQKAQLEAEKQAIENQKEIDKAKASAEVKKTAAQAEADALLIAAEAEAEANRKLQDSLSDEIIRSKFIDKWNGELPQVLGTGADSVLLDLSGSTAK